MEFFIWPLAFLIAGLYFYFSMKNAEKEDKEELTRITKIKEKYNITKIPIEVHHSYIQCIQNETRQIMTGALTYAKPKEYSLIIICSNLQDKIIAAIEFEVELKNAFNETINNLFFSKRKYIKFGETTKFEFSLSGPGEINDIVAKPKRIAFLDGSEWHS